MERKPRVWGGLGEKKSNGGTQWYIQDRIYDSETVSPALTVYISDYWIIVRNDMECKHLYMNGDTKWCSFFDSECTEFCEEFEEFEEPS